MLLAFDPVVDLRLKKPPKLAYTILCILRSYKSKDM